jgi:hypothetical protein
MAADGRGCAQYGARFEADDAPETLSEEPLACARSAAGAGEAASGLGLDGRGSGDALLAVL